MKDPSPAAYEAALGVLAYTYNTKELGLTFGTGYNHPAPEVPQKYEFVNDNDASFGKSVHSFGGGVIKRNGDTIGWFARKCKLAVHDSTCYAELDALNIGLKETLCAVNLSEDMTGKPSAMPPMIDALNLELITSTSLRALSPRKTDCRKRKRKTLMGRNRT